MQTSLRPILVNLAYYNKLKLPLLRGLSRLLNLLASWFNVTLGAHALQISLGGLHKHEVEYQKRASQRTLATASLVL